jgi:hypothetical protein
MLTTRTHDPNYKWIALSNTTLGVLMAAIDGPVVSVGRTHGEDGHCRDRDRPHVHGGPRPASDTSRADPTSTGELGDQTGMWL